MMMLWKRQTVFELPMAQRLEAIDHSAEFCFPRESATYKLQLRPVFAFLLSY